MGFWSSNQEMRKQICCLQPRLTGPSTGAPHPGFAAGLLKHSGSWRVPWSSGLPRSCLHCGLSRLLSSEMGRQIKIQLVFHCHFYIFFFFLECQSLIAFQFRDNYFSSEAREVREVSFTVQNVILFSSRIGFQT